MGEHAVNLAMQVKHLLHRKGYELYVDSPTNQQFVLMTSEEWAHISQQVKVGYGGMLDDGRVIVRFVTSWSTTQEEVDALAQLL